jgi:hypothetical protein
VKIEVSIGEIVDKLSILTIKKERILDENKLKNVILEYDYLYDVVFNQLEINIDDFNSLYKINEKLWNIEDNIRYFERNNIFDNRFIEVARSVYLTNDKRSEIKKEINIKYGSKFVEEKSY